MEVRKGAENEPDAIQCKLGWVVWGRIPVSMVGWGVNLDQSINFLHEADISLERMVKAFLSSESFGAEGHLKQYQVWSLEDTYAIKMVEDGTKKRLNSPGYEVELLWKDGMKPRNDLVMARKRFVALKKKMALNQDFAEDLSKAIGKYIEKGFAIKITEQEEIDHPC
eukprot:TCALIF_12269-PA protein Name:"Protein of unknown function" AED:0.31 eAED:0.31 QI:0/-1/0/1/-1/1/1/0/166